MSHDSLETALRLAEEGVRDPVRAVRNAEALVVAIQRARAERATRSEPDLADLAVDNIIRVDDPPLLQPGQTSPTLVADWPGGEGKAISLFGGTLDGEDKSLSCVSVRIAINGSEDLFTTGRAPTYVPLRSLHPSIHNWLRLKGRRVSPAQKWTIQFQHEGPATSAPVKPYLLFGYQKGH